MNKPVAFVEVEKQLSSLRSLQKHNHLQQSFAATLVATLAATLVATSVAYHAGTYPLIKLIIR